MYCLNCGKEIQESAKFCVYCGAKVTNSKPTESKQTGPKFIAGICPNCGSHLSIDASLEKAFCQYCGTEFLVAKDPETNTFGDINVNISNSSSTDESIKMRLQ
jgi:DNA-directed RNA polymerase subunit RPC12/RpoP